MLENIDDIINTILLENYSKCHQIYDIEFYLGIRCTVCWNVIPEMVQRIPPMSHEGARLHTELALSPSCLCRHLTIYGLPITFIP